MNATDDKEFLMQEVPGYLLQPRIQLTLMLCVALFALVVVNIFHPYVLPASMGVTLFMYFVWSVVLVVFGLIVLTASRAVMYFYAQKRAMTRIRYMCWVALELVITAVIFAVCFYCIRVEHDFMRAFLRCFVFSALIIIPPYVAGIFYLSMLDKNQQLKQLQQDLAAARQEKNATKNIIAFYDERGEIQLSVTKENFLYIESADNYVHIWYLKNSVPRKLVMRSTMQRMENEMQGTHVMRCHRSYLVNMDQVKVLRRDKEGFYIEMGLNGVPDLPVSKTYSQAVLGWMEM